MNTKKLQAAIEAIEWRLDGCSLSFLRLLIIRGKDRILQMGINSLFCVNLLKLGLIIPESAVIFRKIL